jgi:hypothetical protein
VSAKLGLFLKEADESAFLFKTPVKEKDLFVLLVREPSRQNRAAGYCGAGHEDYLLLVEAKNNKLKLLDKFLLQSCYKSLLLESDNDDEPEAALKIDPVRSTITYRLDVDKADEARIIFASSTHFEIKTETHHQD